jgi:hypothetical protein
MSVATTTRRHHHWRSTTTANHEEASMQQTTRVNGKRVVIRTSAKGKVTVADAPIKESEGQAAQVRALRSLPEYGRQFLLAGDMNSAKRGPRAQADAIATGLTPGEADLRIYLRGGALRMIENKVGKGRLSPAQVARHASLDRLGQLLASLSNGNLDSLSEITVGTDDIPIGIGPGVFGTINKAALVQGVEYDAWVANLAGRAAYNGAATGFSVLVIDIGDGRAALYFKNSATSGDWSAPSYITGPVGPAGVNQRGNYSAGTAYAIRDIVQSGGSTWIAKVATTGNAPPTLPVTENTQWLLFARAGAPGVVEPPAVHRKDGKS